MTTSPDSFFKVFTSPDEIDSAIRTTEDLFSIYRQQNMDVTLVLTGTSEDAQKQISRRHHDVKAALRTLTLAIEGIENGYKFDDNNAQAKISAMKKALDNLNRDAGRFFEIIRRK